MGLSDVRSRQNTLLILFASACACTSVVLLMPICLILYFDSIIHTPNRPLLLGSCEISTASKAYKILLIKQYVKILS